MVVDRPVELESPVGDCIGSGRFGDRAGDPTAGAVGYGRWLCGGVLGPGHNVAAGWGAGARITGLRAYLPSVFGRAAGGRLSGNRAGGVVGHVVGGRTNRKVAGVVDACAHPDAGGGIPGDHALIVVLVRWKDVAW